MTLTRREREILIVAKWNELEPAGTYESHKTAETLVQLTAAGLLQKRGRKYTITDAGRELVKDVAP